jgi:hypothetical protein
MDWEIKRAPVFTALSEMERLCKCQPRLAS